MMANNLTQAVVNNMCGGVVATNRLTTLCIYLGHKFSFGISRQFQHDMNRQTILPLGVYHSKL